MLIITRAVLTETEIIRVQAVHLHKVLQGTISRRMAVVFIRKSSWEAESSLNNPYDYPFWGIKMFRIHYGNKNWPTRN